MTWVRDEHPLLIQRLADDARFDCGNELFLLREDLIPAALGGNKVRIAAEFIRDMRNKDANALIMYGSRQSNLCRVLALACQAEGIPSLMITTSEPAEVPAYNERIISGLGVQILSCEPNGIAEAVDEANRILIEQGYRPYYIYGNRFGSGNEGTAANAYAKVYERLCAWERAHDTHFDMIVLPYGTGATQGGLIAGSLQVQDGREIIGISISSRTQERALKVLAESVEGWFENADLPCPEGYRDAMHLESGYNCGGYGVMTPRVAETIDLMLNEAAIPMDPVYSAKAFLGMQDYLREHNVSGKKVLFIHTGGLPIFFDYIGGTHKEHAC